MKWEAHTITIENKKITAWLPQEAAVDRMEGRSVCMDGLAERNVISQLQKRRDNTVPAVYIHVMPEEEQGIAELLQDLPLVLVFISGTEWERDFSPWPAPALFKGQPDFGGGAGAYLQQLEHTLIPCVEREAGLFPRKRILAGYSLSALFSFYALYKTTVFEGAVCASASLWYPGMSEFIRERRPEKLPEAVYFSVGDKEKKTRHPVMQSIETNIKTAAEQLAAQGVPTCAVVNPGGHFTDPEKRVAAGIRWIREQLL